MLLALSNDGAMLPCPRRVLSQETFTLARGTIKSVVEAKVDIRRLRLDPRVVMDIAFAAAGRGHGMTQWLEQTSHKKLRGDQTSGTTLVVEE